MYERRQEKHTGAYFIRPSCVNPQPPPPGLDQRERSEFSAVTDVSGRLCAGVVVLGSRVRECRWAA